MSLGPTAFLGSVIQRQFSDAQDYLVSLFIFVWFSTQSTLDVMNDKMATFHCTSLAARAHCAVCKYYPLLGLVVFSAL
jgi:hypothetical protein